MPRGGKRPGAGRKKGSATKKTRKTTKLAQQAAGDGPLPLEVLLKVMRHFDAKKQFAKAAAIAAQAAPYLHPRLSAVQHGGKDGGPIPHSVRVILTIPENGRDAPPRTP